MSNFLAKSVPYAVREYVRSLRLWRRFPEATIGDHCNLTSVTLGRRVFIDDHVSMRKTVVGDYTYVRRGCEINSATIGMFCSIAPDVAIGVGSHRLKGTVSTHPAFFEARPNIGWDIASDPPSFGYESTVLGNDVWIGQRAIIRTGISVGHGAIIGAGAVVTQDVPDYAVIVGVPGRIIRSRFSPDVITRLLSNPWWEQSDEWLRQNYRLLQDIEKYLKWLDNAGRSI